MHPNTEPLELPFRTHTSSSLSQCSTECPPELELLRELSERSAAALEDCQLSLAVRSNFQGVTLKSLARLLLRLAEAEKNGMLSEAERSHLTQGMRDGEV